MAFLAFEGIDASGKSTLIRGLEGELRRRDIGFTTTRQPGGTELGAEIRRLLLKRDGEGPTFRCELLLYMADRAQHVEKMLRPALERGEWVLCDRYTASSMAFQVGGRGLKHEEVESLNDYATAGLKPDLWVLLDLSVEESEKRMGMRGEQTGQRKDRFEVEKRDFHQRVRDYYLKLANEEPKKWLVLNADADPQSLQKQLFAELSERGILP